MRSLKKHKLLHKVLSSVLAAAVVVSMVSTYSFADEAATEATAQTATVEEETTADDAVVEDAETPAEDAEVPAEDAEQPAEDAEAPAEDAGETAEDAEASKEEPAEPTEDWVTMAANTQNGVALFSSTELEAGTYTISANVSMLTPLGITAYATNPQNPLGIGESGIPGAPVTNNATLVVDKSGKKTLSFELVNPVFTVQSLGNCSDVTIVSQERKDIEGIPDDASYLEEVHAMGYTTRITKVTLELGNWSGSYTFENSKEFATALRGNESLSYGEFSIPLNLTVDFANAIRQVSGDFEKTYTDKATGVSVTVKAEDGSSSIADLNSATLEVAEPTEAQSKQIRSAMSGSYMTLPDYQVYAVSLKNNGVPVVLDDKVTMTVQLGQSVEDCYVFANGALQPVTLNESNDGFETRTYGTFVAVQNASKGKWAWSKTLTDSDTGVSITYSTDATKDDVALNGAETGMGVDVLNVYADYMSATAKKNTTEADRAAMLDMLKKISASDFENNEVSAIWSMAIDMMGANFPGGFFITVGGGKNQLTATIPVDSGKINLYLVSGTKGTGMTSAKLLGTSTSEGYCTVDLATVNADPEVDTVPFYNAVMNCDRNPGTAQTDSTELAYIVAVKEKEIPAEKPVAAAKLIYNTKEQVGVKENAAYTLSGASKATDAGDYSVMALLNDGYIWADGTNEPVVLNWSIAKADPTFTAPTGLTATEGQMLSDVKLPKGFAWADKTASVGAAGEHSFKVIYTPDDTKNYNTAETTVTVKVEKKAEDDTLKPGTYRVTANLFLPGEKNTQLPGVTAYMTNPNNPLGIKPDNMPEGWNFESAAPTTPAENNATLVVKEDGTRVVILDVVNPVFTLQSIKSGSNVTVLEATKDSKTYADAAGTASRTGRVVKLYAQLGDDSGHYYFGDCVEFPTLLGVNWNVALEMGVDFASLTKLSDSTDTGLPGDDNTDPTPNPTPNPGDDNTEPTPTPAPTPTPDEEFEAPVMASGKGSTWEYGSNNGLTFGVSGKAGELLKVSVDGKELGSSYYSVSGSNVTLNASFLNTIAMGGHTVTLTYQGGSVSADFTTKEGQKEVEVVKIKPGTYTVSANIWFEKADSGLPMNPHLTNSTFPPKDPVSNNATLVVDETGRALVTVPIVIQSKVMTIQQITGLNIVSSTTDGNGNLTSITVDLGILEDFNSVITQTCSVRLKMGDLAMSISGFSRDHTWRAQFQVNLSGVPTTTGTATVGIGQNGQTLAPKTGSEPPVAAASALVISAAACIALLVLYKKQRKQNG